MINSSCIGCQIQDGSFKINGGFIHETENFNVVQDYLIPIPSLWFFNQKNIWQVLNNFQKMNRLSLLDFYL